MRGELEIFGAGQLDVLSVGRGHLKLSITEGDQLEVDAARRIIEDMLQRGFAIFVEEPDGTTKRVKKFNAKKMTYLIDDTMDTVPAAQAPPRTQPAGRARTKEVPVTRTRATAVGRTAGG